MIIISKIIILLLILPSLAMAQSDMDYQRIVNALTELSEVGRDVYELGFNDGVRCMVLMQLKYKYGDNTESIPTLNDMAELCRVQWYVKKESK